MVRTTIRMLIPPRKRREALGILNSMTDQTRIEPGCMSFRIYRDVKDKRAIMLEELWANEKDLQHHLRSDQYRNVLLVVEMAVEPPEIRFDTITHSAGVEIVEQARGQTR